MDERKIYYEGKIDPAGLVFVGYIEIYRNESGKF